MPQSAADSRRRRPTAASISLFVGILAWLSPLIVFIGGMLINSGGRAFAGDGGPNLIAIIYLTFGAIASGVLGIVGSLICLFCGTQIYPDPEVHKAWLVPKLLNYPLGLFGLIGGIFWIASVFHL